MHRETVSFCTPLLKAWQGLYTNRASIRLSQSHHSSLIGVLFTHVSLCLLCCLINPSLLSFITRFYSLTHKCRAHTASFVYATFHCSTHTRTHNRVAFLSFRSLPRTQKCTCPLTLSQEQFCLCFRFRICSLSPFFLAAWTGLLNADTWSPERKKTSDECRWRWW